LTEDFDTDWSGVLDAARTMMAIAIGEEVSIMDTFDAACRRADRKAASQPRNEGLERLRRLLDADVSIERAWAELNGNRSTAEATVEAVKEAVRSRGVSALDESATRERLARCGAKALNALDDWLIDFEKRHSNAVSASQARGGLGACAKR
jgi:hypothetical protein